MLWTNSFVFSKTESLSISADPISTASAPDWITRLTSSALFIPLSLIIKMPGSVIKVIFPDKRCQFFCGSEVDFKSLKVPVVNSYNSLFRFQGQNSSSFLLWTSTSRLKSLFKSKLDKSIQFFPENACNQKHKIAIFFLKLHPVNNEIFPEDRQAYHFSDSIQIFK